jgi:hypothetical protein
MKRYAEGGAGGLGLVLSVTGRCAAKLPHNWNIENRSKSNCHFCKLQNLTIPIEVGLQVVRARNVNELAHACAYVLFSHREDLIFCL